MVAQSCHTILMFSIFWIGMPYARGDWLMGFSYYQQGKYRKAIHELSSEIKDNPEDVFLNRMLGLSYYQLKDYSKAEIFLRTVGALQPDFQVALELAQVYVGRSEYDGALQTLEESRSKRDSSFITFPGQFLWCKVRCPRLGPISRKLNSFQKKPLGYTSKLAH